MSEEKFLRRMQVERRIGLGRSSIYRTMQEGTFPRPVRVGKQAVAWRESEVTAWMPAREATHA